ncbi:MAG TPA: tetratricopeptide repeat protein [Planctomycetota bacterium]|nr:tetratricopeptide repeat protein [Planctomycetota bacterium]
MTRKTAEKATLLFGLVFLSSITLGDDIILKDGEVVEGKIDTAATNAANKGKSDANAIVVIVQVDEAGKKREIRRNDIQGIVSKKPSWELHKEALDWYDKNSPRAKDTYGGQQMFARQCQSRGLEEQAHRHYTRALEFLRKENEGKGKTTVKDHERLAEWCRKNGLLGEEKNEFEAIVELMLKGSETASDPLAEKVKVADWVRGKGQKEKAIDLYQKVLDASPGYAPAEAGIKAIKETAEFQMAGVVNEFLQSKRAWSIKVAIEDDADAPTMKEWEEKLKTISEFIWEVTEGQFFVHEWTLEDQTSAGQIIIEKGKLQWGGRNGPGSSGVLATTYGLGTPGWVCRAPGKVWANVLVHEMFHGIFGLLDEYYQNPQCPCVMRSAPSPQRLCNAQTHKGGGRQKEPCVDSIKKRDAGVSFPNPNWTTTKDDVQGARDRGTINEMEGFLKRGEAKIEKPPVCKVIVIDK